MFLQHKKRDTQTAVLTVHESHRLL